MLEGDILYNDRFYLTPQEILEKEFKVDARGYRPQEVDKFLDMVIRDYTEYANIIKKLEKDIKNLMEDNSKLKQEIRRLQSEKLNIGGIEITDEIKMEVINYFEENNIPFVYMNYQYYIRRLVANMLNQESRGR